MNHASVEQIVAKIRAHRERRWAWSNFLPTVEELILASDAKRVLEIGGGRRPAFERAKVEAMGIAYTSNDISAHELSLAPDWVDKAHFDIQGAADEVAPFAGKFDFAFSKMVMEHVESYSRAYANIHSILAPGGVAIAFHPVLYSLPFAINKVIPERTALAILRKIKPDRTKDVNPKFPAWYDGCVISERLRDSIREIGFRDVWQLPFYGHGYYEGVPVLRNVHQAVTNKLARYNVTTLASFAFTIVRK